PTRPPASEPARDELGLRGPRERPALAGAADLSGWVELAAPRQLPGLLERQGSRLARPQEPHGVLDRRPLSQVAPRRRARAQHRLPLPDDRRAGRVALLGLDLLGARGLRERVGSASARQARLAVPEPAPPLRN